MSSADKLLSVLGLFSTSSDPWTVDEVASALGLPQSTTYRYIRSLANAGLVVAISAGSFVLGPSIVMLDRQMRRSDPLLVNSADTMRKLSETMGVPGVLLLCRLFRSNVMCVHSIALGTPKLEVSYERGRPMPLFRGAASKAILASLPPRTVRGFFDQHAEEFAASRLGETWQDVKYSLRMLRNAGVVATHSEIDRNVLGIASPIFDGAGQVLGSIGFVEPGRPLDDPLIPAFAVKLKDAAQEITGALKDLTFTRKR